MKRCLPGMLDGLGHEGALVSVRVRSRVSVFSFSRACFRTED